MKAKLLFTLAFVPIAVMIVYFIVNPSYEKSLEAKYYYETGAYKKAYALASKAFDADPYNRMASTIMAQSKISMKYQEYIDQAAAYMQVINTMIEQESLDDSDRIKIKMMSEIMVDSYKKLASSVVTNEALVEKAQHYYENFKQILEKVNH